MALTEPATADDSADVPATDAPPAEPAEPPEPAAVKAAPGEIAPSGIDATSGRSGGRAIAGWLLTALAATAVLLALTSPEEVGRLTPLAFLRLPLEGIIGAAVLLAVPTRARRWVALGLGAVLGLAFLWKLLDMGFLSVMERPFDPALDWTLFDDAESFLTDSIGLLGAVAVGVLAALLALGIPTLLALAVLRLSKALARRRIGATRAAVGLTALWVACALLGTELVPGEPFADRNVSQLAYDRTQMVQAGIHDQSAFAAEAAVDSYRNAPTGQLLAGLRGKDVLVVFVESYGRSALENPQISSEVRPALQADSATLATAGFAARSGFLTSSTVGSGSGLAHATTLSGLWINSNRRWRTLTSSSRFTLSAAFAKAGWRTVGIMPANTRAWPEGDFYRFAKIWDDRDLGYRGPAFSWATMPDQYVMAAFQRDEFGVPSRAPLFAQINLVSSHAPWVPVPTMVDDAQVGDGSVFGPQTSAGPSKDQVWSDPVQVRQAYGRSIGYSVGTVVDWLVKHGNDNTVVIMLGDHQPLPLVTDSSPNRDVPVSIIAKDPAVLTHIDAWGWQNGITPDPSAPVWPMSAFRDRFFAAYSA